MRATTPTPASRSQAIGQCGLGPRWPDSPANQTSAVSLPAGPQGCLSAHGQWEGYDPAEEGRRAPGRSYFKGQERIGAGRGGLSAWGRRQPRASGTKPCPHHSGAWVGLPWTVVGKAEPQSPPVRTPQARNLGHSSRDSLSLPRWAPTQEAGPGWPGGPGHSQGPQQGQKMVAPHPVGAHTGAEPFESSPSH